MAKMVWITQCLQHILIAWFCFLLQKKPQNNGKSPTCWVGLYGHSSSPLHLVKIIGECFFQNLMGCVAESERGTYCLKFFEMLENSFPYRMFSNNAVKYGWTWPFLLKAHISCLRMGHSYLELLSQRLLQGCGATENHTRIPKSQCFHHSVRLFMMKLGKLNGIKTDQGCERHQEGFL